MNLRLKWLAFLPLMLLSALVQSSIQPLTPFANNQVTVKLVLGEKATLPGYQGVQDETIYHRNVVAYTAAADSNLPTPTKPGTTFVSWVYAQSSALVRVNKMPKTSGATYYAYWQGDGSLATTIPSSSSSSSSSQMMSSSVITSTEIVTSSSEAFVPFNLYLQAKTANVDWTDANAQIRIFYWNAPTNLEWPGTMMVAEGNGLYSYRFENFRPTDLLFVRLNPNNTTEVWNQTIDLTYPNGQNLFTLTAWNNGEGKSTGSWSTYSPTSSSSLISSSSIVTSSETTASSNESSMTSSASSLLSSQIQSSSFIASSSIDESSLSSTLTTSSSISNTSEIIPSSSSSQMVSSESTSLLSSNNPVSSETSSQSSSELVSSSSLASSVLPIQFDVYLKVNDPLADWSQGNATFKIHYWGNDQSSNWNQLPSLTSVGNGIYHYAFFDYQPTHVLFQRRSSDQTIIWNMTIDYTYPGDDALLTITSWTSQEYCGDCLDQGTKSTGVWSTYSPA